MEAKRKKSWRLIKPKVITLVLYGQEREVTLERAFNCGSQQRGGKAIMKNEISLADFSSFETRSQGEKFIFRFSASKLYTKAKFVINIWQWQREKKEWKKCCLGVEWANHFSLRSFIWRSLRNIIRIEPTEFYRSGLGAKCMLFFPPSPPLSSVASRNGKQFSIAKAYYVAFTHFSLTIRSQYDGRFIIKMF